jgi:hypothetical protein
MSQALWASDDCPSKRLTLAQSSLEWGKLGELRAQFCCQATHASLKLSALNPGSSAQVAKTHLLLAFVKTGASASRDAACGAATTEAVSEAGGGVEGRAKGGAFRGEEQAVKSQHTVMQMLPTIHDRRSCCMGLILLEALLALVLLVLIVWWTMFSGRDKGELRPGDKEERDRKPADKD